ncbi:PREDICTED: uncharacterized protein LOC109182757 [Ipomoea nil]|uniref:uncharacterized protein LOC109182757 n=1 Tax=Ipomoea nil TaxID=35883 RepID=UPI0009010FB5|nr:PREDICTED: uncharacterized protein LOC109182757 [Ipomoea nil]
MLGSRSANSRKQKARIFRGFSILPRADCHNEFITLQLLIYLFPTLPSTFNTTSSHPSIRQQSEILVVWWLLEKLRMTRGNQRERDRERAQARAGHKPKQSKGDGLTPEQRRERDAKALQEKAARKAAARGNNTTNNK